MYLSVYAYIYHLYICIYMYIYISLYVYISTLKMKISSKGNKGKETSFLDYFRTFTTFQGILLLYPYIHICMHVYILYVLHIYMI